jgi:3-oxoacyl-[acyl-carrier protein] reductase
MADTTMDLKLRGKKVLITGASKGIGRATAQLFAAEGCDLVLVSRTAADLDAVKDTIRQTCQVNVVTVAADLSDSRNIDLLALAHPDIDILVNNAGAIPGGALLEMNEARWRAAWDLKVFGYINMCRAYYGLMKTRGHGVIVNMVGNAAQSHDPEYICGVVGNAALTALSQSLGSVSHRDGIRVVSINPGPVATERLVGLLRKTPTTGRNWSSRCRSAVPLPPKKSPPWSPSPPPTCPATPAAPLSSSTVDYRQGRIRFEGG